MSNWKNDSVEVTEKIDWSFEDKRSIQALDHQLVGETLVCDTVVEMFIDPKPLAIGIESFESASLINSPVIRDEK